MINSAHSESPCRASSPQMRWPGTGDLSHQLSAMALTLKLQDCGPAAGWSCRIGIDTGRMLPSSKPQAPGGARILVPHLAEEAGGPGIVIPTESGAGGPVERVRRIHDRPGVRRHGPEFFPGLDRYRLEFLRLGPALMNIGIPAAARVNISVVARISSSLLKGRCRRFQPGRRYVGGQAGRLLQFHRQ